MYNDPVSTFSLRKKSVKKIVVIGFFQISCNLETLLLSTFVYNVMKHERFEKEKKKNFISRANIWYAIAYVIRCFDFVYFR